MRKITTLIITLLLFSNLSAQERFIDTALIYKPLKKIKLASAINETSGLIYYDNLFWTINDSGGKPIIYGFNEKTGGLKKKVKVLFSDNFDWESICQDSLYIYIGDFGNNSGTRKLYKIFKISKKSITDKTKCSVIPEVINFTYEDQTDFTRGNLQTAYDCEAFMCYNDKLYLFSKNWKTRHTTLYKLPNTKGKYKAKKLFTFNSDGLITGADISKDNKIVALIGYKNFYPFMWIFTDFKKDNFFSGNKVRLNLNSIYNAQTESIAFKKADTDTVYVTCEKSKFKQSIFTFPIKKIKKIINY
ncbi:MAG: T9SS C-terminal target domain-containing protein [Bacteroidetes bacterium]|nr:MAG: T9SS C-terminal target domain-containing protein [Bacteroidota bacterium]